jgi:uroporphyrinogen-III synthase
MKTAFISRAFDETPDLEAFLTSKGFEIQALSMIQREYIPFTKPEIYPEQWLFFSSPYAVKAWFDQGGPIAKLAAIGEGSANALQRYHQVDFCGTSSDTTKTAAEFIKIVTRFPVIFPSAEKGLRQIQQALSPDQFLDIVCYRTLHAPQIVAPADLYIFSSPSNVHAFFSMNKLAARAKIVAYGPSTSKALRQYQQSNVVESTGTSSRELINAISSALER